MTRFGRFIEWLFRLDPILTPTEHWLKRHRHEDKKWRQCYDGPLDGKWVKPKSRHLKRNDGCYALVEDMYSSRLYYLWRRRLA